MTTLTAAAVRLAIGDLTAALVWHELVGRTNLRIKGWMSRADQATKVKACSCAPSRSPRSAGVTRSSGGCASS